MSLKSFFRTRTGKSVLAVVTAFNTASFVSSAQIWAQMSKAERDGAVALPNAKSAIALTLLLPALAAVDAITKEGHIESVFERGTPNDWIANAAIMATEPFIGQDNAGMVALGIMTVDSIVSWPGSLLGAGAGFHGDRWINGTAAKSAATSGPAQP